jgi:hypothetical protein
MPPGLPIFGLLTSLPATPLYKRLEAPDGSRALGTGWISFRSPWRAHSAEDDDRGSAHSELNYGWAHS